MFIFEGNLSTHCKNFINSFGNRITRTYCGIIALLLTIATIFCGIIYHWMAFFALPFIWGIFIVSLFVKEKLPHPIKIVISEETVELYTDAYFYNKQPIYQIKKIIDYGDFYFLKFSFPGSVRSYVCQKNLMTVGTIEEFENFFAGQIIKKIK